MKAIFNIIKIVWLIFIPTLIILACVWTDRNIDFALTLYKGHVVNCPWWLSTIATFVLNGVALLFNVVMEIVRVAHGS